MTTTQGDLFAILLRLHPVETSQVPLSSGHLVQSAFLDIIRQSDPALSDWLHQPNQRRPYTLGLLGFHHLSTGQRITAMHDNQTMDVLPGQVYWLRITLLESTVFRTFLQHLILKAHAMRIRIGAAQFEVSRILTSTDPERSAHTWVGHTTFQELHSLEPARKRYPFAFASPTAFSKGQRPWGKMLALFPEPGMVFESLARQWEAFAPAGLRMEDNHLTPRHLAEWISENIIVQHYDLQTCYVPSGKFGHTGFQGEITYEVKGNPTSQEARWLTTLALFAFYSGTGHKTTMGMGQTRCDFPNAKEKVSKEDA